MRPGRVIFDPDPGSSYGLPVPDRELTPAHVLRRSAERFADRRAIEFEDRWWTYRELWAEVELYARALVAAGVHKGTRVAVLIGARPEYAFLVYATHLVGGVAVPISTFSTAAEVAWILQHSDTALLVAHTAIRGRSVIAPLRAGDPDVFDSPVVDSARLPFLRRVVWLPNGTHAPEHVGAWNDFVVAGDGVSAAAVDARLDGVVPDDDSVILYTSGSTAAPKAVLHTHRAPAIQGFRMADCMAIGSDDVTFTSFPTFWSAGLVTALYAPLSVGACTVLQETFEPDEALDLIEGAKVTSVRQMAHDELRLVAANEARPRDLRSVDVGVITPGLAALTSVPGGVTEICGFGMTETFTNFTMLPFDSDLEIRRRTMGFPPLNSPMRISDPDTGETLKPGEVGAVSVGGPLVCRGYYKQEPMLPLDELGYLRTGDTGYFDAEGRFVYTGRLDRIIKSGGFNVSPVEVEERLLAWGRLDTHVVLAVPHPTLGQAAVLCATRREGDDVTEAEILSYLREELASIKVPRWVVLMEQLPLTSSSKVVIPEARALAIARMLDAPIDDAWKALLRAETGADAKPRTGQ